MSVYSSSKINNYCSPIFENVLQNLFPQKSYEKFRKLKEKNKYANINHISTVSNLAFVNKAWSYNSVKCRELILYCIDIMNRILLLHQ